MVIAMYKEKIYECYEEPYTVPVGTYNPPAPVFYIDSEESREFKEWFAKGDWIGKPIDEQV